MYTVTLTTQEITDIRTALQAQHQGSKSHTRHSQACRDLDYKLRDLRPDGE